MGEWQTGCTECTVGPHDDFTSEYIYSQELFWETICTTTLIDQAFFIS